MYHEPRPFTPAERVCELSRRGKLGSCDCEPTCGYCGEAKSLHVPPDEFCPFDAPEQWIDGALPDTYYVETHRETHWSPAEGISVCERCQKERE